MRKNLLLFFSVAAVAVQINGVTEAFAGLSRVKPQKSRLTGFVTKESAGVLRLDTGSTLYRLDAEAVIQKNPRLKQEISGTKQATVEVEAKDILASEAGESRQAQGGR